MFIHRFSTKSLAEGILVDLNHIQTFLLTAAWAIKLGPKGLYVLNATVVFFSSPQMIPETSVVFTSRLPRPGFPDPRPWRLQRPRQFFGPTFRTGGGRAREASAGQALGGQPRVCAEGQLLLRGKTTLAEPKAAEVSFKSGCHNQAKRDQSH